MLFLFSSSDFARLSTIIHPFLSGSFASFRSSLCFLATYLGADPRTDFFSCYRLSRSTFVPTILGSWSLPMVFILLLPRPRENLWKHLQIVWSCRGFISPRLSLRVLMLRPSCCIEGVATYPLTVEQEKTLD